MVAHWPVAKADVVTDRNMTAGDPVYQYSPLESVHGTKRTWRLRCAISALGGKAENICSRERFRFWTQTGRRRLILL